MVQFLQDSIDNLTSNEDEDIDSGQISESLAFASFKSKDRNSLPILTSWNLVKLAIRNQLQTCFQPLENSCHNHYQDKQNITITRISSKPLERVCVNSKAIQPGKRKSDSESGAQNLVLFLFLTFKFYVYNIYFDSLNHYYGCNRVSVSRRVTHEHNLIAWHATRCVIANSAL
jgi:hypothetical protein